MIAGWLIGVKWQIPCGEGLHSRVYTVQRCSLSLPVFRILVLRMLEGSDYNTPPPGGKKLLIQPEGEEAAWSDVSASQAMAERAVNKLMLLVAAQEDQ